MLQSLFLISTLVQRQSSTVLKDGPDLSWLMGVVAILILSIAGLAYGFRKVVVGSMKTRASKRDLVILDMLPLGGKRQLAVVRCYDRTFALGLGEKSVDLVAELDHDVVQVDREEAVSERNAVFQARLKSAKERLLGEHGVLPGLLPKRRSAESTPTGAAAQRSSRSATPSNELATSLPAAEVTPPSPLGEVAPRTGSNREFVA